MVERAWRARVPSRWAVALVALLAALALPSSANHPQTESGRVVVFDHRTGNDWWVEAILSGQDAGSAASVEAQDTNGPWTKLEKKSWGVWAASFRIEPGHDVRFRASWPGGAQSVSCWFSHPAGVEACTTAPPPPPPPTSGVSFDHKGGNEWWVEASVSGATPTRVQAMDEGGPWTALTLRSWGAWASSFRIEPGHDVRFRAEVGGAWTESCWFTHPAGHTPTGGATCGASSTPPPPPPSDFATFSGVKGNQYWAEVRVAADRPLAGVEARIDDGTWRALALRDWGAWAASFFVPDGSYLDFRATATDGTAATSADHVWPTARPVQPWPAAGSFATYVVRTSGGAPDGSWSQSTDATLRLTYDGAAWRGRCVGTTTTTDSTGALTTTSFDQAAVGAPATGPQQVVQGQSFDPALFEDAGYASCQQAEDTVVATEEGRFQTSLRDSPGGRQVVLASWMAHEPPGNSPYEADTLVWETRLGLLLDWSHSGRGGGFSGHLIDTDAPIR